MAEILWSNASGGAFNVDTNWTGGAAPGAADDAILDPLSGPYTVTSSADDQVNSVQLDASATLSITGGDFTATMGTGSGVNAGLISVGPTTDFTAGGDLDNTGVIQLNEATPPGGNVVASWPVTINPQDGSNLVVASAGLTLSGGGQVYLENPIVFTDTVIPAPPGLSLDEIEGEAGAVLTNVNNTIYGAGTVGLGALAFVNEADGVFDATLSTPLQLQQVDGGVTNDGLLEDTGQGGLYIVSTTVNQTGGGVIEAIGGIVYFSYADVIGGTLTSSGTGHFYWDHGVTTLDGTQTGGLTNDARVFISDGAILSLVGNIINAGQFGVGTGSKASEVMIGAAGVTLSGGGGIALQGSNPDTAIVGAGSASILTNVNNVISGQGVIGGDGLTVVNDASGVIDASARNSLILDAPITNGGLIEATSPGCLEIESTINNAGGEILAAAHTTVLLSGADVQGGSLVTTGNGVIEVTGPGTTLDGTAASVNVVGELNIAAGATLTGLGSIDVSGQMGVSGQMVVSGAATLEGALANTGLISVDGGALTVQGAVSGGGLATIDGGSLTFASTVNQSVDFLGAGKLSLADSAAFSGAVAGFAADGSTSLDLQDVAFVSASEATFSGGATGGYLTITDGVHTTSIYLAGDYLDATFTAASDNAGGTIVTAAQTVFNLTTGKDTIDGGPYANTVVATAGTLNPTDEIDAGSGSSNTLVVEGGGNFNLGAPSELSGLATIDVAEGQQAWGGIASTFQSVALRAGLDATIDVASSAPISGDPNPVRITITGAAGDSSTIDLGGGLDVVRLGSAAETVNGGAGAGTVDASAATAGALLGEAAGGTLDMVVTGGGAINLNGGDSGISVFLRTSSTAYELSAGAGSGLLINDQSSTADTLSAGGSGQTFTGGAAGQLTLIDSTQGGDVFEDIASRLNGDTIENFAAAGNEIEISNLNFNRLVATFTENAAGTQGVLNLSDGTHAAEVVLFGQFAAANYSGSAAGAGFVTTADSIHGTDVTWAPLVPNSAQGLKG